MSVTVLCSTEHTQEQYQMHSRLCVPPVVGIMLHMAHLSRNSCQIALHSSASPKQDFNQYRQTNMQQHACPSSKQPYDKAPQDMCPCDVEWQYGRHNAHRWAPFSSRTAAATEYCPTSHLMTCHRCVYSNCLARTTHSHERLHTAARQQHTAGPMPASHHAALKHSWPSWPQFRSWTLYKLPWTISTPWLNYAAKLYRTQVLSVTSASLVEVAAARAAPGALDDGDRARVQLVLGGHHLHLSHSANVHALAQACRAQAWAYVLAG